MPTIYQLPDGTEISEEEASQYEVLDVQDEPQYEQPEEAGWGDIARRSSQSLFPQMERAAGGLLRFAQETPYIGAGLNYLLPEDLGQRWTSQADDIQKYLDSEAPVRPGSTKDNVYRTGQMMSGMLPYLTQPLAAAPALIGVSTFGNTYDHARDRGTEYEGSTAAGVSDGSLAYLTSLLPFGAMASKLPVGKKIAATTLANTAANFAQTAGSESIVQGITGPQEGDVSPIDAALPTIIPSLLTGGVMGLAGEARSRRSEARSQSRVDALADAFVNEPLADTGAVRLELGGPETQQALPAPQNRLGLPEPEADYTVGQYPGKLENYVMGDGVDLRSLPGNQELLSGPKANVAIDGPKNRLALPAPENLYTEGANPGKLENYSYDLGDETRIDPAIIPDPVIDPAKEQAVASASERESVKIPPLDESKTTVTFEDKTLPEVKVEKIEEPKKAPFSEGEKGSLAIGDIFDRTKQVIEGLLPPKADPNVINVDVPDTAKFFDGEDGLWVAPKAVKKQVRQWLTQAITLAERDSSFAKAYEGSRNLAREFQSGVHQDISSLQDFMDLPNPDKVSEALFAHRKAQKMAGQPIAMTPERLMRHGFNEQEVKAFFAVRDYLDGTAKEKLREYLHGKADGYSNPEEKKAEIDSYIDNLPAGYVPQVRRGAFEVRGRIGKEENVSHHATRSEANRHAQKLNREHGGKFKVGRVKNVADSYNDWMSGDLSGPLAFLAKEMDAPSPEMQVKGFNARLQKANLIEGYSKDLKRALAEYVVGVNRARSLEKVKPEFENSLIEIQNRAQSEEGGYALLEKGNLFDYTKDYIDDIKNPNGRSKWLSSFMFHYALGGNIKSAALNLTQPLTVMYPALGEHVKNPLAVTRKAYAKANSATFNPKGFKQSNPELFQALERARENGTVSGSEFEKAYNLKNPQSKFAETAKNVSGFFQKHTESYNRTVGFVAGFEAGKIKGLKGDVLQKFAEDFTHNANFGYGVGDRSKLFRKAPELAIFRQFTAQYLRQFFKAAKGQLAHEDLPKVARQMVGMTRLAGPMLGLTGAFGLPFINSIIKGFEAAGYNPKEYADELMGDDTIADLIEYGAPGIKEMPELVKASKWAFGKTRPKDIVQYGLPMAAGLNLSGSLGLGSLSPDMEVSPFDSAARFALGPAGQPIANVKRAYDLFSMDRPGRAVEALLPPALAAPLKAKRFAEEGITTPKGETLAFPEELSNGDILATGLSFNTAVNTRAQDRQRAIYTSNELVKKKSADRNRKLADILVNAGPDAYAIYEDSKDPVDLISALPPESKSDLRELLKTLPEEDLSDISSLISKGALPQLRSHYNPILAELKKTPKANRDKVGRILQSRLKDQRTSAGQ